MNWIFRLYVVYGLVQVNMKTVDKSCVTPCTMTIIVYGSILPDMADSCLISLKWRVQPPTLLP
jgi:hypothetical protein